MSKKLELKIVTPERLILDEEVESVTIPTTEGELTILPGHISIIASLASGDIVAVSSGEHIPMAVVGGFLEVRKEKENTVVVILADFAEHVSEISEDEIIKAKNRAAELEEQHKNNKIVDIDSFSTENEHILTRIKIADKWRTRKYRK